MKHETRNRNSIKQGYISPLKVVSGKFECDGETFF